MCGNGRNKAVPKIYYVEDDAASARFVKEYLEQKGCQVEIFSLLETARAALRQERPDLVLVDWNMPDGQGDGLCRWIREQWPALPLIFLTVRGESRDIVCGFENGADDYVVKPFELEVLYSRIQALLRRAGQTASGTGERGKLCCGGLTLDAERMRVFSGGKEVALSQPEYQLFQILMENKGRTVTRARLLEQIWDSGGNFVNDNTLTVTMKRLREKLGNPACIRTIRSFGYRMEETL